MNFKTFLIPEYADGGNSVREFHKYFISAGKTFINGEMLSCLQGIGMLPLNLAETGF